MAVVQLIDLSVGSKEISEFRFFRDRDTLLSRAYRSISGPEGLEKGLESSALAGLRDSQWSVAKGDYPKSSSNFPEWDMGLRVRLVFVIAWSKDGIALEYMQPDEKFWIIHPHDGKILAANSTVAPLKQEIQNFVGGTSVI